MKMPSDRSADLDYFDLHCDTATRLYDRGESLDSSSCHISKNTISQFRKYAQITAVFSSERKTDEECFQRFSAVCKDFTHKNKVRFANGTDIENNCRQNLPSFILSVEDARLLSGDMGKFDFLADSGVKLITPLWSGVTCIGCAFDTDGGLSPFGKRLISRMLIKNIIPDISHASRRSADYILDACREAGAVAVATHSNSFSVCAHPRNLTDGEAQRIAELGGVIGISLAPQHLTEGKKASETDVIAHIEHYRRVVGDGHICLGCDFDGIENTPLGIEHQGKIPHLRSALLGVGASEKFCDGLFWDNAYKLFTKII